MARTSFSAAGAEAVLHPGRTIYVPNMPRHPFLAIEMTVAISIARPNSQKKTD
jgi:hypothetical protein